MSNLVRVTFFLAVVLLAVLQQSDQRGIVVFGVHGAIVHDGPNLSDSLGQWSDRTPLAIKKVAARAHSAWARGTNGAKSRAGVLCACHALNTQAME